MPARRAGRTSGNTTRHQMANSLDPSMRAASSSSLGTPTVYWRIKKIPNAPTALGTKSAWYELNQLKLLMIWNCGTSSTWNGIMSVASMMVNSTFLKRKSYLAKANPARELNSTDSVVPIAATTMVFTYQRP